MSIELDHGSQQPGAAMSPSELLAAHGATVAAVALGDLQFAARRLSVLREAALAASFRVDRERIDSGEPLFVDGTGAQLVADLLRLISEAATLVGGFAAELAPMAERLQVAESLAQRERTGASLH